MNSQYSWIMLLSQCINENGAMKKLSAHRKWIALVFTILLGVTGAATVQAVDNLNHDGSPPAGDLSH